MRRLLLAAFCTLFPLACSAPAPVEIRGDLEVWNPLTLVVKGPESAEEAEPNPFLDYRMTVRFEHESGILFQVPGYFAADGNAAETSATEGTQWKAHFLPSEPGLWTFTVSLRFGEGLAIDNSATGQAASGDGTKGEFTVVARSDSEGDARHRGKLRYVGSRYLQFAATGEYFLKSGADSPENFLAYVDFDGVSASASEVGTRREGEAARVPRHRYSPHEADWRDGDPSWKSGRGKGIIGALNYLASQGVNSVYFLPMNVEGDGNDVWPYTQPQERYRFDCSKLEQWGLVFDHMDRLGIMLHVVLTETENENLFESEEGGSFADSRRLYYREMTARLAHHSALVWNLGEENGWSEDDNPFGKANSDDQRKSFAQFIRSLDPYENPIVVHTLPGRYDEIYPPLLGFSSLEGPSLQMGDMTLTHAETIKWVRRSGEAGRQWFVSLDEIGPAHTGVKPDAEDPDHDDVRHYALWGNLMAGGAGCEWYFGYRFPHNDLNLEDFRSREQMWKQTALAVRFFREHLPFPEMESADALVSNAEAYCFARAGEVYAIYLGSGGTTRVWLPESEYVVHWFDPRTGGALQKGTVESIIGPGWKPIGQPPSSTEEDWLALVTLSGSPPSAILPPETQN